MLPRPSSCRHDMTSAGVIRRGTNPSICAGEYSSVLNRRPYEVAVGNEHVQRDVQIASSLAYQPRLAPQSTHKITRHRLGVVDREKRVPGHARQLAVGRRVHESVLCRMPPWPNPGSLTSRRTRRGPGRTRLRLRHHALAHVEYCAWRGLSAAKQRLLQQSPCDARGSFCPSDG